MKRVAADSCIPTGFPGFTLGPLNLKYNLAAGSTKFSFVALKSTSPSNLPLSSSLTNFSKTDSVFNLVRLFTLGILVQVLYQCLLMDNEIYFG